MVIKLIMPTSFPVIKVASIKLSNARVKDSNYFYFSPKLSVKNVHGMSVEFSLIKVRNSVDV